jgi:hypothetical protein
MFDRATSLVASPGKEDTSQCIGMLSFIVRSTRSAPAHADLYLQAKELLTTIESPLKWPDPHEDRQHDITKLLYVPPQDFARLQEQYSLDMKRCESLNNLDVSSQQKVADVLKTVPLESIFATKWNPTEWKIATEKAMHNLLEAKKELKVMSILQYNAHPED